MAPIPVDMEITRASAAAPFSAQPVSPQAPLSPYRVLLVDDEDHLRNAYQRLLESAGFTVETASNGRAALAAANAGFDVIVSDISMPDLDGVGFLRGLRAAGLDVPVVLMTGAPTVDTAIAAVEQGALSYLRKPIDAELFVSTVLRAARLNALARLKREALAVVTADATRLGERAALEARFAHALDTLWMAYQPIVSGASQTVASYEALVRNDDDLLGRPDDLLAAAERLGKLHELGRTIRRRVAADARLLPLDTTLYVNLHPSDLVDDELYSATSPLAGLAAKVVLEITERATLDGVAGLAARLSALRQRGYRIAVDDLGAGYAGLSGLALLEPDIVKIDMSLVRGVDTHVTRHRIVKSIARLCRDLGISSVAEGIETTAERDALLAMRVDYLQGYLFARPGRGFGPIS